MTSQSSSWNGERKVSFRSRLFLLHLIAKARKWIVNFSFFPIFPMISLLMNLFTVFCMKFEWQHHEKKLSTPKREQKCSKEQTETYFIKSNLKENENLHQMSIGYKKKNMKYVLHFSSRTLKRKEKRKENLFFIHNMRKTDGNEGKSSRVKKLKRSNGEKHKRKTNRIRWGVTVFHRWFLHRKRERIWTLSLFTWLQW